MINKRFVGTYYEKVAAEYLIARGYEIIEKNYRCCYGEIDLIALEKGYLVFIEVKFRSSLKNGYPQEAVNFKKQQTIYRVASQYLYTHKNMGNIPCRFDVVSILKDEITVIPNAFGGIT